MTHRPLTTTVLAVLALTAAACGGESDGRSPEQQAPGSLRAADPPKPTIVSAADATGEGVPKPARKLTSVPRPGTVTLADGPFNDKLRIDALKLRRGSRPQVTGRMLTVSDVSEVLALTIDVAFYDRRGSLVATGRLAQQEVEEFFDRSLTFRVRASEPAADVATAVLSVPEYVPE